MVDVLAGLLWKNGLKCDLNKLIPTGQNVKTLGSTPSRLKRHTGRYVRCEKTIATQAGDVAESRAHTKASVAGCLSRDVPLWLSER